jgi:hypothetical protein
MFQLFFSQAENPPVVTNPNKQDSSRRIGESGKCIGNLVFGRQRSLEFGSLGLALSE